MIRKSLKLWQNKQGNCNTIMTQGSVIFNGVIIMNIKTMSLSQLSKMRTTHVIRIAYTETLPTTRVRTYRIKNMHDVINRIDVQARII